METTKEPKKGQSYYSLILLCCFIFLFSLNAQALELEINNSYSLSGSLGTSTSNFSNSLRLDYRLKTDDYQFSFQTRLLKEYQTWYGKRYDDNSLLAIDREEFAIIPNYYFNLDSEKWRLLNYKLQFDFDNNSLQYGNLSTPGATFLSGGSLDGTYFEAGDYGIKLWYGKEDRFGVKQESQARKLIYQVELEEQNKHYFSYDDRYLIAGDYLSFSSIIGLGADDYGPAFGVDYGSRLGEVRYDLSTKYRTADFERLTGAGQGRREVSLRLYRPFSDFFSSYRSSYRENNLSGELGQTTRNLNNNFSLDYYGSEVYRFNLDYNLNFEDNNINDVRRKLSLKSQYQQLDYETGFEANGEYPFYETATNNYKFFLTGDYDFEIVEMTSSYDLSKQKGQGFGHDFNFGLSYERELFEKIDYDADYNLDWAVGDRLQHKLNQRFNYNHDFDSSRSFKATLNSTLYLERLAFSNNLTFRYNHRF